MANAKLRWTNGLIQNKAALCVFPSEEMLVSKLRGALSHVAAQMCPKKQEG